MPFGNSVVTSLCRNGERRTENKDNSCGLMDCGSVW